MVIENGGKIETMSFWTTIWRFYNVLEIRHQYIQLNTKRYFFIYFMYLCTIYQPFIILLFVCALRLTYLLNIKILAQSNIFLLIKPIFAAIFVTIGAIKVKSV